MIDEEEGNTKITFNLYDPAIRSFKIQHNKLISTLKNMGVEQDTKVFM